VPPTCPATRTSSLLRQLLTHTGTRNVIFSVFCTCTRLSPRPASDPPLNPPPSGQLPPGEPQCLRASSPVLAVVCTTRGGQKKNRQFSTTNPPTRPANSRGDHSSTCGTPAATYSGSQGEMATQSREYRSIPVEAIRCWHRFSTKPGSSTPRVNRARDSLTRTEAGA